MQFILESEDDYEVYFSHQCDDRGFNRGAIKNIGFLAMKEKYPNDYKQITFIFNDVDTLPFNKIFKYNTVEGVVKHFYGFRFALGGIVAITGADFEKINGFPCYWGWGMEDSALQTRCQHYGIMIDRSVFYPIGSQEILQLFEGINRLLSRGDPTPKNENGMNNVNGLSTIFNLTYQIEDKSPSLRDNVYTVSDFQHAFINITSFDTMLPYENDYISYDLRNKMPIDKAKKIDYNHNKKQMMIPTPNSKPKNIPVAHRNPPHPPPPPQHQSALPKTFRLHRRGKYSFL
jgi:hypothetical protein